MLRCLLWRHMVLRLGIRLSIWACVGVAHSGVLFVFVFLRPDGVGVEEEIEVLGEVSEVEEEEFERPETPHDIILSRVQQMVRERPEDAAKLIRTMLVEEAA